MRDLDNSHNLTTDHWELKTGSIRFGRLPAIMGILNVTPDSFSDGGQFIDPKLAVEQALRLVDQGADIIDVGGESTRPYSDPVPEAEELRRTVNVVAAIAENTTLPISIDTSKAKVAFECVQAGAEIINDVTGLEGDPEMVSVAIETGAGVCAMHMQGTPQTMQDNPEYSDIVSDISAYLEKRKRYLLDRGIVLEKICLDPGIGFGKTHQHNLSLIAAVDRFHELRTPILVGHSRKGFIGKVLGSPDRDRAAATAGVAIELARKAIQIVRVHDVQVVKDAIVLFDAVGGIDGRTCQLD